MSLANSSFILKNDGTLWGCGNNDYGQLGLGDTSNRETFTQITNNTDNIKSIYCSHFHTIILKNDGTLWGCGRNNLGQLGLGDTTHRYIFTQITTNVSDIKSIYCGQSHTIILKNDGTLWGCGRNDLGELGLGDTDNRIILTQITINTDDIKSIYCGDEHTIMLKNDGTLWGCGWNKYNQLGLGEDTSDKNTFTQITNNTDDVKSAYCGSEQTFILKNDGTLWGCGYNKHGQLGLEDTNNRTTFTIISINSRNIKEIFLGAEYMIILKNDGTLWSCGYNSYGQLGLGDANNRTIFTIIGINTNDIKSVYCGYEHTLILKNDGTLWGCGHNNYYQLGLENTASESIFTQITTNTDDIKYLANNYSIPSTIKIYDSKIGYTETLDTNNFRNIPINSIETLKVLYEKPDNTILNCIISFDKKQTWKTFNGNTWIIVSDTSGTNIIVNCMGIEMLNSLDKKKLIQGGFTGNLDFKCVMKTNDVNKTPSVTKIYIEYK